MTLRRLPKRGLCRCDPEEETSIILANSWWAFVDKRVERSSPSLSFPSISITVSAIGDQTSMVGQKRDVGVDAVSRKLLNDHLLTMDVTFEAQVSPFVEELAELHNKRRIPKVWELFPVRIDFCDQLVRNVDLEVVAVGTDNSFGESNRCVPARPVKRWFEHDLFRRIALRLVESRARLRRAENVSDPVIANAVPGAEVAMSVVVKGAPANSTGVSRIGRKLVMNSGMAQGMFRQPLYVIDRLRRIRVSDEFRIQIAWMIRRLQRKAEIVHGEDIFDELRLLTVANATGLTGG